MVNTWSSTMAIIDKLEEDLRRFETEYEQGIVNSYMSYQLFKHHNFRRIDEERIAQAHAGGEERNRAS